MAWKRELFVSDVVTRLDSFSLQNTTAATLIEKFSRSAQPFSLVRYAGPDVRNRPPEDQCRDTLRLNIIAL